MLVKLSRDIVLNQSVNPSEVQQRNYVNRLLKPALRAVWNDILIHIFYKTRIRTADIVALPRHRIWWYPTGPLTFIPIHAAGPGGGVTDVSRLVISPYVTTLGSLLQMQRKHEQVPEEQQKFLGISQLKTPGQSSLLKTMEVNRVTQVFRLSGWLEKDIICLHGKKAIVCSVSSALDSCSWLHLACHGSQDPAFGMESAFALRDGDLEFGEIASKRLSTGQFAFQSACHAASGLNDLPGEALHLAAGIQFAGFPSVITTLWIIRDEDAPEVADYTYRYLFRNELQRFDSSEAATALNRAALRLREEPDVTVDSWAPFVHFGI